MLNKAMSGKITEVRGAPNPNSYIIEDDGGKTYLVHVGDIEDNEQLLYKLYKEDKITKLSVGDTVKFQPDTSDHAIHVKKAS
jgi:hypothetical protein